MTNIYKQAGTNPFCTAAKIQVWADQKSRRSEQMQQIFVFVIRNIFHVASTAYLRQKGQAQQIIGEITRDFEGVRVSQLEATFFEVLLYLANSRFCISVDRYN